MVDPMNRRLSLSMTLYVDAIIVMLNKICFHRFSYSLCSFATKDSRTKHAQKNSKTSNEMSNEEKQTTNKQFSINYFVFSNDQDILHRGTIKDILADN